MVGKDPQCTGDDHEEYNINIINCKTVKQNLLKIPVSLQPLAVYDKNQENHQPQTLKLSGTDLLGDRRQVGGEWAGQPK